MKRNFLLLTVVAFAALFSFSACKKDKDKDEVKKNAFTYGGKSYDLKFGSVSGFSRSTTFLLTTAGDGSGLLSKSSMVMFEIGNNPLVNGTYTYKSSIASGFDDSKNFDVAGVIIDQNPMASDLGTELRDLTSGTIAVSKNGDSYAIEFTLVFQSGTVKGSYSGKLTEG